MAFTTEQIRKEAALLRARGLQLTADMLEAGAAALEREQQHVCKGKLLPPRLAPPIIYSED